MKRKAKMGIFPDKKRLSAIFTNLLVKTPSLLCTPNKQALNLGPLKQHKVKKNLRFPLPNIQE
jgi:hypothetical protein